MTSPPSVGVNIRQGVPPTPMQRGLLASQGRHPTAPLQNMALLSHFAAEVDVPRLIAAFETVVHASDVLRSQIVGEGSGVSVRVRADAEPTAVVDVALADAEQWAHERVA